MPDTTGGANEEPQAYAGPTAASSTSPQPGAANETHEPRVDQLYRASFWSVPATVKTPG